MEKYSDSLRGYAFEIHKRDHFKCVYCGVDATTSFDTWLSLSCDHLLPKDHPQRDNPEYMATACNFCNTADNRYFDQAKKRGLQFDGMTRDQLIAQRIPFVEKTRDNYKVFWDECVCSDQTILFDDHVELDTIDNLIDNLVMVAYFLESPYPLKWKWAIISLHQALYTSIICALQGSDARQTIFDKRKDEGKALSLHAQGVPDEVIANAFDVKAERVRRLRSNANILGFDEAFKRVKERAYLPSRDDIKPLITKREEEEAVKKLKNEFRNEFEHFAPKRWIIHTQVLFDISSHVLRIVHFLLLESNCVILTDEQESKIISTIHRIQREITK